MKEQIFISISESELHDIIIQCVNACLKHRKQTKEEIEMISLLRSIDKKLCKNTY